MWQLVLYLHKEMAWPISSTLLFKCCCLSWVLMQTGKFSQDIDYKSPFSSLFVGCPFWKEAVFDWAAGGISGMQVDALFLSLTALGIIQLQILNTLLQWSITQEYMTATNCFIKSHVGHPMYKRDDAWQGVHLFCKSRVRKRNPGILLTNLPIDNS